MTIRVLIVDDDAELRAMLREYLEGRGFAVAERSDGNGLEEAIADSQADIVLLDLMLPGEDGLSLCRRLRQHGIVLPVIMLTAKGDEIDRIVGLEVGADDYLPKPFNPRELVARINAVTRRRTTAEPAASKSITTFGPYTLDLNARSLHCSGIPISLTSGEFNLLAVFAQRPRQPLDRDRLLALLKAEQAAVFDRAIDTQISRLRKKIEPPPDCGAYLQTVRGFGYVFVPDGSPQ